MGPQSQPKYVSSLGSRTPTAPKPFSNPKATRAEEASRRFGGPTSYWTGVRNHFGFGPRYAHLGAGLGYSSRHNHGNLGGHAASLAAIRHQSVDRCDQHEVSGLITAAEINHESIGGFQAGGVAAAQQSTFAGGLNYYGVARGVYPRAGTAGIMGSAAGAGARARPLLSAQPPQ